MAELCNDLPEKVLVGKKKVTKKVVIEQPKKAPAKRAKKQPPTKEEIKDLLNKSVLELDVIVKDLTEEKAHLIPLNLKRMNELVDETLKNLNEDLDEMKEKIKEINETPSE